MIELGLYRHIWEERCRMVSSAVRELYKLNFDSIFSLRESSAIENELVWVEITSITNEELWYE